MRRAKQLISDAWTALNALLQGNSNITSLLGKYLLPNGTPGTIPLIKGGILAEKETDLPAIVFEGEPSSKLNFLGNFSFLINVYTATAREGFILSSTIMDEFNQCQTPIDGYFTQTTCNILTQVTDPTSKEVNTPVEIRLINM